jgi:uncharacterized protein YifN (PemK superfamily)
MTENKLPAALILGISFILGISVSLPAAAKLYKWVDENGTTHYGETIPPEYADKDRAELNKAGRVIKKQDVLTPEELRAERTSREQEETRKLSEEQAILERKRRDRALVDTYSSSGEIDLARKRNLQQIELRINGINANIKRASDNLQGLQKEADAYTNANRKIPVSLQEDLQEAQKRLNTLQQDLEKPQAEKAAMEARYDADKARYKELTGK